MLREPKPKHLPASRNVRVRLRAPSFQLLDEMDEVDADLVVVGSRGLGVLHRASMGSISDQIATNAPAASCSTRSVSPTKELQ